ncbi:MAG: amidohydrolase family protein [Pseudomonadota bacterium]|nr:amidohydrolase family protein [Pseudomonadota bacterium]
MSKASERGYAAIDAVVNICTPEALEHRRDWWQGFLGGKMNAEERNTKGVTVDAMLAQMDAAGIDKAFLIATRAGPVGIPSCYQIPYDVVADAVAQAPDRLYGLAGVDPVAGMDGVREMEYGIRELGFVGAHFYPHWFEIEPNHAKVYPFYAKCVELDVPIQMQVGQSMNYAPDLPRRSVGRPIALDAVACDFPELKLIGIHVGIPWTDEMIAMAWKHRNVFIGCDAHAPKYWPESFVRYIDSYGSDKVIFGTDYPVLGFERMIDEIEALGIRPASLRKLLRDNVLKIYGMEDRGDDP